MSVLTRTCIVDGCRAPRQPGRDRCAGCHTEEIVVPIAEQFRAARRRTPIGERIYEAVREGYSFQEVADDLDYFPDDPDPAAKAARTAAAYAQRVGLPSL